MIIISIYLDLKYLLIISIHNFIRNEEKIMKVSDRDIYIYIINEILSYLLIQIPNY